MNKTYADSKWFKSALRKSWTNINILLAKDMINRYSIINGAKYVSSVGLQNYLVFAPINK